MIDESSTIFWPTVLMGISGISSLFLGLLVLQRNLARRTHRIFTLLCFNLTLWCVGVLGIIHSHSGLMAEIWIRATFAVAVFLPATFYHFILFFPYQRLVGRKNVLVFAYGAATLLALGALSPWYIQRLDVFPTAPPQVSYGPVFYVYFLLIMVVMVFSVSNLMRKLKETEGIQRRQVEHVFISFLMTTVFGSLTNVLAPMLEVGTMEIYGPCFVVLMVIGVAYAMMRYHLLDIWVIISRTTLYAVVTGVVILVFLSTVSVVHWVFSGGGKTTDVLTTVLAALLIVLVIQPLKEHMQLILDRLVVHRRYDANKLIERLTRSVSEYVQLDELLDAVCEDIKATLGVSLIRVLLVSEKEPGAMVVAYSTRPKEIQQRNFNHDYILDFVRAHPEPLVLEELLHSRTTPKRVMLAKHLAEIDAYLLTPLKSKSGVVGILTLGQKQSRDIYIKEDIKVFSALAGSLATAIENARLYDQLEALNIHLERIMTNMRGGVLAVDEKEVITTVNQGACEILGHLEPGMTLAHVDEKVRELLRWTLRERKGLSDVESLVVHPDGQKLHIAMSSSSFSTNGSDHLGAMVLLHNMTRVKNLESNVQRADRLTSIGTMAAGMAHEIKNPLQSIKTFSQLLPQRFEDPDFRKTFTEVVPPEVQRIDNIVARLLDFARPKPISFGPRNLVQMIEDVLALVENQLRKADVEATTEYPDLIHEVKADDQQLHQVFLNLIFNAVDAVKGMDRRCVAIRLYYDRAHLTQKGLSPRFDVPCMCVEIKDSGCGIAQENLPQLFTPFFTTKTDGTGLGLSVVHGIVMEHGGEIDVSSAPGEGTVFRITLPLIDEECAVERMKA